LSQPPPGPLPVHCAHVCVIESHCGVKPPQNVLSVHCTHPPEEVSQAGVSPVHTDVVPLHWLQDPSAWHAG
jgi:hypothetical protein